MVVPDVRRRRVRGAAIVTICYLILTLLAILFLTNLALMLWARK